VAEEREMDWYPSFVSITYQLQEEDLDNLKLFTASQIALSDFIHPRKPGREV
jgi:hypothetical protein